MRSRSIVAGALMVGGTLLAACAPPPVTQAALTADLATLKREIRRAQEAGTLSRTRVTELAQAVARREVHASEGQAALDRIHDMGACVGPVSEDLRARARGEGEAAAAATLLLVDAGIARRAPLLAAHKNAVDGAWRAVAANAARGKQHSPLRRRFIVDGDERVRRAALRAALASGDAGDVEVLLEAARLDPDPQSRALARQALGVIGVERAVLGLKDAWPRAPEADRISIIDSWGAPQSFPAGGERELLWAAQTQTGMLALSAAAALLRNRDDAALPTSPQIAEGILLAAIRDGATDERRLAIRLAPAIDAAEAALVEAAKSADAQVKVLALARLLEFDGQRKRAQQALRKLSEGKGSVARQARAALAELGDASVAAQLREQLVAKSSGLRRVAALGLLRLGDYATAATALGDDSPAVRAQIACRILATSGTLLSSR